MPLPVIMLMGAAAAGTAGAANGVKGAQKMYESNKDKKMIEAQHAVNTQFYEKTFEVATKAMDELGEFEIMIMSEFQDFSDVIEKIENRPKFGEIKDKDFKLPEYSADEIQKAAVGAIALASGIGGAALGTFGGFAAAGATTAAVAAVVGILYDMLKAKLVEKKDENYNQVNQTLLNDKLGAAHDFLSSDRLIKKDMLGVLEHHVEDELVNEKLPEKEIAIVEENELTKNVKDLSGKVGKSVSETATKVSKLIKPGTCPSCGAKLDKGAKFCNKCGVEISS